MATPEPRADAPRAESTARLPAGRSTPRSGRLVILGSTGSIGKNALAVLEHMRAHGGPAFEVIGLAAHRNANDLQQQARAFGVTNLALAAEDVPLDASSDLRVRRGADAALELVHDVVGPGDIVIGAMVGAAGIAPTIAAIERGASVALANKETLVAAGSIVMPLARERGVDLLPVDSEHSAIFQCLAGARDLAEVERLVVTASGGPFRTWTAERMRDATVEEALAHPTWSMGRKVTIDSASMMNKALELIEAHHLFGLGAERIDAIVHPQSIVHSFVEYVDGSVLAQLSPPDMRLPIQLALTWPGRTDGATTRTDWASFSRLDFEAIDDARFPAIATALAAIDAGGDAGAVLNAANEVAVDAFLDGRLRFGGIHDVVAATLQARPTAAIASLEDVYAADREARATATEIVATLARSAIGSAGN